MRRRALITFAILALVVAAGAQAVWAGGGHSLPAKLCQKNGWQTLQTSSGGTFTSQDQCVSYAATGGSLFGPKVTAVDLGCSVPNVVGQDLWMLVATGFTPNSSLTLGVGGVIIHPRVPFDIFGSNVQYFLADPAATGTITESFTDASGVQSSVTFGPLACDANSPAFNPSVIAMDLGCNNPSATSAEGWMLVGTGFAPGSPMTINGFSAPYSSDRFGSVLIYRNGFPVGVTQTETVADNSGGRASLTWGPPAACP